MVDQKILVYGSIAGGFVAGIIIAQVGGIFAIIGGVLAGLGSLLALLFNKYGYILVPYINQNFTKIVINDELGRYEIPESQDVVVKKVNGIYYATSYILLRITESASNSSREQILAYNEQFERALASLKYVTKISLLTYVEDITKKRQDIEARRGELQLRLSREREKEAPDPILIDKWERELQMWDARLNDLIRGVRPMGVIAFASVTASGLSRDSAMAAVRVRANEVKSILSNSLNVDTEILKAEDMLRCFEWERFLPVTPKELEDQVV